MKTSTRNKHTPLNEYVSFSQTPAAGGGDGDPTLDELLPGPTAHDPVNQVISTEELHSLVACLSSVLSELESGVLSLYLDGYSYEGSPSAWSATPRRSTTPSSASSARWAPTWRRARSPLDPPFPA